MLTAADRKKLAKEARKLAMEIVIGDVLPFANHSYAFCAIGEIASRAGLTEERNVYEAEDIAADVEAEAFGVTTGAASNALVSEGLHFSNPDGAVFPLLALADKFDPPALDEPRAAPSPTPNTRKER